jgi:transcriptional repressor NF-X1
MPTNMSCRSMVKSLQYLFCSSPCQQIIDTPCRCQREFFSKKCSEIKREDSTPICDHVCKAKLSCRRHRCDNVCCDWIQHECMKTCGKTLKCTKHHCNYACGHLGPCHDCYEGVSFDEMFCHCGRTKMYPPIPCNSKPPICSYPCKRPYACRHRQTVPHECHGEDVTCPPCMIFVRKSCACGKQVFGNVPCSRTTVPSCGKMCEKPSEGCGHLCSR